MVMRRVGCALLAGAVIAAGATVPQWAVPQSALAATSATVALSPAAGPPGGAVTVRGTHFGATEAVDVSFDTARVATAHTTRSGSFTITLTVPAAAAPGTSKVRGVGRKSHRTAQATFTVLAAATWAQWRADPARSGSNPAERTLTPATVGRLHQLWSAAQGGPGPQPPAVAGGVVFTESTEGFRAFDAGTGAVRWTSPTAHQRDVDHCAPGTGAGVVVQCLPLNTVLGLDAGTGAAVWNDTVTTFNQYNSSPAIVGDTGYLGFVDRSDRENVTAYDIATGHERWTRLLGQFSFASVAVADGRVYVNGGNDGTVYALDAGTGAVVWSRKLGILNSQDNPVAGTGQVYLHLGGSLLALDAATGAQRWSAPGFGVPTVSGTVLYGTLAPDGSRRLAALDALTGKQLWAGKSALPDNAGREVTVAGGVAYVSAGADTIEALDARDGTRLWTGRVASQVGVSTPVVVGGRLYVVGGGTLFAFGL